MSDRTLWEIILTVLQSGALAVVIVNTIRLMLKEKTVFLPFMFVLAMVSFLLSDLYWIAYDLLKPDTRMPIACNEIGECAIILLLSAGLDSLIGDKKKIAGEIVFAFLFMGANIALWIAWSGEWFQDILFGIPYVYFLWVLIRGLRYRGCMTPKELLVASAACVFVLIMQIPLFVVKGNLFFLSEIIGFGMMFAVMAWLGVKSVRSKDFFVTASFFLWTELSMFLTPDFYYDLAMFANTISFFFMFNSMKKELANDIC
ncbi:hypothetical protein [Fibrobacter sp.]|uniref:hypothetical protein n=1 Tax=Fibrobacter sp. TaxID=35828 RepID=UPI0025B7C7CB|nr:hypothetical protein [Fibrobacter sp.]MBR3071579.1 hypothetical protein [Fibrobacter sp.]